MCFGNQILPRNAIPCVEFLSSARTLTRTTQPRPVREMPKQVCRGQVDEVRQMNPKSI